jgi:hypothetical protein
VTVQIVESLTAVIDKQYNCRLIMLLEFSIVLLENIYTSGFTYNRNLRFKNIYSKGDSVQHPAPNGSSIIIYL